ncbi:Arm DNA-binding domain-containing protein [Synechococcus sp. R65.1]|uniref:Arm DNA-binding domain-containing protein n=1 Tax=Synechococcus sp. R65.1 TaxID=2964524 RepID=UPI0039C066E6
MTRDTKARAGHGSVGDSYQECQTQGQALPVARQRRAVLGGEAQGSRLWRFRYRFRGQERRLSLGEYPYIPLREGRSMYGGPSSWLLSTRSQAFRVPASYCSRLCNKMSRISPG